MLAATCAYSRQNFQKNPSSPRFRYLSCDCFFLRFDFFDCFVGLCLAEAWILLPQSITAEHLDTFLAESNYSCQVAREGELVLPPPRTVEITDWERARRLRQGQFAVVGEQEEGLDDHEQVPQSPYLGSYNMSKTTSYKC